MVIEARGLLGQILGLSFIAHLDVLTMILSLTNSLSELLQSSNANFGSAASMITAVKSTIDSKRESGWPVMWENIEQLCLKNNVPIHSQPNRRRKQRTINDDDCYILGSTGQRPLVPGMDQSTALRTNLYCPLLDEFKMELTRRKFRCVS